MKMHVYVLFAVISLALSKKHSKKDMEELLEKQIIISFTTILEITNRLENYNKYFSSLVNSNQNTQNKDYKNAVATVNQQIDDIKIYKNRLIEFTEIFLSYLSGNQECINKSKGFVKAITALSNIKIKIELDITDRHQICIYIPFIRSTNVIIFELNDKSSMFSKINNPYNKELKYTVSYDNIKQLNVLLEQEMNHLNKVLPKEIIIS